MKIFQEIIGESTAFAICDTIHNLTLISASKYHLEGLRILKILYLDLAISNSIMY